MNNTEQLRSKLLDKLKELFQLNQPDLDFGFYRIMHARAREVSDFIEHDLLDTIKTAFDTANSQTAETELETLKKEIVTNFGDGAFDPNGILKQNIAEFPLGKKYLAAQKKFDDAQTALTGEDSVYYHLYRFFSRYYDNGDFVSMRYHTRETEGKARPYAIPYGGEEVMLHWANSDQYYIKTSECFRNFSFDLAKAKELTGQPDGELKLSSLPDQPMPVHFKIAEADEGEHGNIKADDKKKRGFYPAPEKIAELNDAGELVVYFEFRYETEEDRISDEDGKALDAKYQSSAKGNRHLLYLTDKVIEAVEALRSELKKSRKDTKKIDLYLELLNRKVPTDGIKERILLTKYLYKYTASNTSDYFIHKNLKAFLLREMDFYIKNEIMNLDDVMNSDVQAVENYLVLLKVFRKIAGKLIDFLGQLEDFQKKLWLKKKFVVQCDYCITLDRVPEEFYPEIANNHLQWQEWAKLGLLTIEFEDGYTEINMPQNPKDVTVFFADQPDNGYSHTFSDKDQWIENCELKQVGKQGEFDLATLINARQLFKNRKSLMVDTKFFSNDFKIRLLASIEDFDKHCDGLLLHSENFQALNLLQQRYRKQVKSIYIDPPYNTGDDDFLYKDSFRHGSWASMFTDRLNQAIRLLNGQGLFACHMDEHEHWILENIIQCVFGISSDLGKLIWDKRNPKGEVKGLASQHEYVHFAAANLDFLGLDNAFVRDKPNAPAILAKAAKMIKQAKGVTEKVRQEFADWVKDKHNDFSNGERAYCFLDDNGDVFRTVSMAAPDKPETRSHRPLIHPTTKKACPVPAKGWRFPDESMKILELKHEIIYGPDETTQPTRKYLLKENMTENVPSVYYMGGSDDKLFKNLNLHFENPKPVEVGCYFLKAMTRTNERSIVLDFFAGSGTTAHSVIALNRNDKKQRRYILADMGEHFNTVIMPRIKKVVFSPDWKDGKPESFDKGISHCFKYMRLESYEDTLNNLVMPEADSMMQKTAGPASLREDYALHYMLDTEAADSLLNVNDFADPFGGYHLNIKQSGSEASVKTPVDLVETFNYLIGLRVEQYYRIQSYKALFKRSRDPELPKNQNTRWELDGKPELCMGTADPAEYPWRFQKIEGKIPANPLTPNDGKTLNVLIVWRTQTKDPVYDNLMLDWYLGQTVNPNEKTPEYDIIYINGSNNLGADRKETDFFQVRLIEEEFLKQMWAQEEI